MKSIKSMKLLLMFSACVFLVTELVVKSKGQEYGRSGRDTKVEVITDGGAEVKNSRLNKLSHRPTFEYRVSNSTSNAIPYMNVEFIAFDENNELVGGLTVRLRVNLGAGADSEGDIAISSKLASAARLTARFVFPAPRELDGKLLLEPCSPNFCGPNGACGSMAKRCKKPPISYHCEIGETCICEFECG